MFGLLPCDGHITQEKVRGFAFSFRFSAALCIFIDMDILHKIMFFLHRSSSIANTTTAINQCKEDAFMDMNRVKQIISSPTDVSVYYNGVPVWIDDYNEKDGTAKVHMRDGLLQETREVPVEELEEENA